jgi:acetyl-CoA acetyltransferase
MFPYNPACHVCIAPDHAIFFVPFSCRQCSSGLQAIADVAAAIKAGYYTIGLAGGVETMSSNPMAWEGGINPKIDNFPKAQGCLMPMGVTSENVAAAFNVNRQTQDTFAAASHRKAAAAQVRSFSNGCCKLFAYSSSR